MFVVVGITMFGLIYYLKYNRFLFLSGAIISRILQGVGSSSVNVVILSLISIMFPKEEVSSKIGLNESFVGIAWLFGPMIGKKFKLY